MEQYKKEFIEFMIDCEVLKFGDFVTKSGRKTPFFVNTAFYRTGSQLKKLGEYYAQAIMESFGGEFDVLFGPAYKFLSAYTLPVFWIVGLVGYALWYVAHLTGNVVLFYVAIILAGFGTNTMTVGVPMLLSTLVLPAVVGAVMGFSYVFQNGGGFLASPIDQAVMAVAGSDAILSSVWIFNVILGIVLLLGMFWVAKRAKAMKEADAA